MRYLNDLLLDVAYLEFEVATLAEDMVVDTRRITDGKVPFVENMLDVMYLVQFFGNSEEFHDIVARYPDFVTKAKEEFLYWAPILIEINKPEHLQLRTEVDSWAFNNLARDGGAQLPESEIIARREVLKLIDYQPDIEKFMEEKVEVMQGLRLPTKIPA